jgi:predicted DNA-binding transcriptional regulator AlpA
MHQSNVNDYPVVLTAKEVAQILQVSKPLAYQLMGQPDFPLMKDMGRTKRVLRDRFFEWMNRRSA